MFTDIEGYTALSQSDEARALELLDKHNHILRSVFRNYHGREVKAIGDSFLVQFDSALDAVKCAAEIQRILHDHSISTSENSKIRLRIGIHLGDVVSRGRDIFGDAVNIASRIQPLSEPEGICITKQVFAQVQNKIPDSIEKLEQRELKNVKFSTNVYALIMPWERQIITGSTKPTLKHDKKRIAVLPFSSLSPDSSDEYFADGITEELISTISRLGALQVIECFVTREATKA